MEEIDLSMHASTAILSINVMFHLYLWPPKQLNIHGCDLFMQSLQWRKLFKKKLQQIKLTTNKKTQIAIMIATY